MMRRLPRDDRRHRDRTARARPMAAAARRAARLAEMLRARHGCEPSPLALYYLSGKTGVALKTKRCSRFASRRSSVFERVALSLSMMS